MMCPELLIEEKNTFRYALPWMVNYKTLFDMSCLVLYEYRFNIYLVQSLDFTEKHVYSADTPQWHFIYHINFLPSKITSRNFYAGDLFSMFNHTISQQTSGRICC